MTIKIRKPAGCEDVSLDDLMSFDAGQAYVLDQFCERHIEPVEPEHIFRSDRGGCDPALIEVYEDGSIWFINSSQDEVNPDATDWLMDNYTCFKGFEWEESTDYSLILIDDMDKNFLIHILGEEEALYYFEQRGGVCDRK